MLVLLLKLKLGLFQRHPLLGLLHLHLLKLERSRGLDLLLLKLGLGHLPGVVLGALLLAALPEVLRYVASPLQAFTGGRLDASILRQLLIALAMITIMLMRPRGLWPTPDHGKSLQASN